MRELKVISCCTGAAQLERGADLALREFGYTVRPIAYVECKEWSHRVIRARVKDQLLHDAPIWPDLRTFPARRYRGHADAVIAGFPCQDLSVAGQRNGIGAGTRSGLFYNVLSVAETAGCPVLLLENVEGIFHTESDCVMGDGEPGTAAAIVLVTEALSTAGYRCRWIDLGADDVGAPHGRNRFWCVAWKCDTTMADRQHDGRASRAITGSTTSSVHDNPRRTKNASNAKGTSTP